MRPRSLQLSRDTVASLLVVLLWCRAVGSLTVLSLTADKTFVAVGQEEVTSKAASLVSQGFFALAAALCVLVVVFRVNDTTRVGLWRLAAVLAPWLWLVVRDAYSAVVTPDSVLYVLVVLALAALRPSPRVLRTVAVLVIVTAVVAMLLGLLLPSAGILRDAGGDARVSDKETIPGLGLLEGMFTSENNLAQYLALGASSVLVLPRWWLRATGLLLVGVAVYWSSSRGAMIALGVSLAVAVLVWVLREGVSAAVACLTARIAIVAAVATMVVLPLLGWDDDAFTKRGDIWNGSLAEWVRRAPWFGFGSNWYQRIAGTETTPFHGGAYTGHNQVVHLLATGGLVLAVLAVASLLAQGAVVSRPSHPAFVAATSLVVAVAVSGFLEVPLGFVDRSMFWTVGLVPLTIVFFARGRRRRRGGPTGAPSRERVLS
jgi:hypothetical protein